MNRRSFLKVSALAGGGLLIGLQARAAGDAALTPWVRITADDAVTIVVSQAELGQGISTTLPAILADELGADWSRVRFETAPYDKAYRNPQRNWMFTGNSESSQAFYDLMRQMGAAAREMLTAAAAVLWSVAPDTCVTRDGFVIHAASGRRASFGELAASAATLPVPASPRLRPESELRLLGRRLARVDVPAKVDGSAVFGIDFALPGMLYAAVRTAPEIGGSLKRFDAEKARSRKGVRAVVPLGNNGVAVVAESYWQAKSALMAMELEFAPGPNSAMSSDTLMAAYQDALANGPFAPVAAEGNAEAEIRGARRVVRAQYQNPFLAHATMEPMNCTARVSGERCEIWAPTQGQELAFFALQGVLGLPDERISVNRTPYIGGGFGRRLLPDFVVQAALISKAVGQPVKTIWDREEDLRRDHFRPASLVALAASLDAEGYPRAMTASVVSPTILLPVFPAIEPMLKQKGIDPSALEGMMEWPYSIAKRKVDFHLMQIPVPTSVLRTTGYGPNIFALESFVDELAHDAVVDPYRYRRRLLSEDTRAVAVLDRAAKLASWGERLPKGRGRGIAYAEAFGSRLAQVVDVSVQQDQVKVRRVVSVVDAGRTLDPGIATASVEGGVVFGLAGAKSEITFANGRVLEDNYHRYVMPYLAETPELVTEFIDGGGKLGGVGEVSPVTVLPALANAIHAATGRRLRSMPLARHGLRLA